jgi:hypothetical protein
MTPVGVRQRFGLYELQNRRRYVQKTWAIKESLYEDLD